MKPNFEQDIMKYLEKKYGKNANYIYSLSYILQYIIIKTKSANSGAKARGSFANLYAIYVVVEDYLKKGYDVSGTYSSYEGAQFGALLNRQRELPFGAKLQNHALNSRMNQEFFKFFPMQENIPPIMRDAKTQRYWFNENYLNIDIGNAKVNIAKDIINIIDMYILVKQENFKRFIEHCEMLQKIDEKNTKEAMNFIKSLLAPNVDARLFEIVSFSLLKFYYKDIHKHIVWGFVGETLKEDYLHLYKTGRTNANDGGIDFVMRPLGRFFQVTETLDFKKYFLDIEKIEKYPLSFVIKSEDSVETLKNKIQQDAKKIYGVDKIVENYMSCIEEIINIPKLYAYLKELEAKFLISKVLEEIVAQSKVEFNYEID